MNMVFLVVGAGMGLGVLMACLSALWRHPDLPRFERLGLAFISGGIVWGGIDRALTQPIGLGDLLLLCGLILILWRYFRLHPKIGV